MKPPDDTVRVLVEIPKGSRHKYEFSEASGAMRMDDGQAPNPKVQTPNHKVLCVPLNDPAWNELDDLPGDLQDEITHSFSVYTDIEGKGWRVHGWAPRDEAVAEVAAARRRHDDAAGQGSGTSARTR